jgi:hypothetical protein
MRLDWLGTHTVRAYGLRAGRLAHIWPAAEIPRLYDTLCQLPPGSQNLARMAVESIRHSGETDRLKGKGEPEK